MNRKRLAKSARWNIELLETRNLLSATWTPLTHQFPDPGGTGTMILLSNGTVMVQDNGFNAAQYNQWYALTPDASGNYANGTWSQLASMSTQRLYFASNVLPSGQVFVVGGEYSDPNLDPNITNTGEIYNPVTNSWSSITPYPEPYGPYFGDDPSMVLPNGNIMAGDIFTNQPMIYNPSTNSWSPAGAKNFPDRSDEEGWVKLPNGDVLTYDIFRSIGHDIGANGPIPLGTPGFYAEMYNPTTNTWIDVSPSDGTAKETGPMPQLSSDSLGFEMGPSVLMPNGDVFMVGATGHTALYNPNTNTWSPGPDVIGSLPSGPALFGADDAPGAVVPSTGDVLFTADAGPTLGTFSAPTEVFDYNPNNNKITQVSSPDPFLPEEGAYPTRMLVLPTGQILFTDGSAQLFIYTPDGHPQGSWEPSIQSVTNNNDGTFTLTGTQLNGQSAGATYGDDAEMDSNYPIIYLTNGTQTYYARTYNWSSTGVQTGNAVETVNFVLPSGIPAGYYTLYVSGAGISSHAFKFQVTESMAMAASGGVSAEAGVASLLSGSTSSALTPGALTHGMAQPLTASLSNGVAQAAIGQLIFGAEAESGPALLPVGALPALGDDSSDQASLDLQPLDSVFAGPFNSGLWEAGDQDVS